MKTEMELKEEYEKFVKTEKGQEWIKYQKEKMHAPGDLGDYIYDFYPEMLQ